MTVEAPREHRELDVVLYSELLDTVPQPRRVTWERLAADLMEHDERTEKDGPGWSATVYRKRATRGKAGVEDVTALVLDVDHGEPAWSLLDGLEYVAHTTWKHHASSEHVDCRGRSDCPHWRVVLPLAHPVHVADWDDLRARARFWLCPNADESAKDAPRFFWLPTCRPGYPRDSRRSPGRWLDPDELRAIPAEEPARRVMSDALDAGSEERPGDRFEREADWCRDILPDWKPVGVHGDNLMLRRPGSTNPYGATISARGQGVLYVFSDGAAPLEPNTCYSKFGAYCVLHHGGDFKAAARALAERYGMRSRQNGTSIGTIGGVKNVLPGKAEPGSRPLTETGNAERLVDQFGQDIRFCHPWGAWLHWDGTRWKRDQTGAVRHLVKDVIRSIRLEAAVAETKEQREALWKWATRSETAAGRAAMLKNAEVESGIPILTDDLDRDPYLFTVLNGTIDLRAGELRPHNRMDCITKLAPVVFDKNAECPTFLRFLDRILPDLEVRRFVRRMAGYSLTGDTREQCLFFLYGGGSNGKSTLLTVLRRMMGDYAQQAAPNLLVDRKNEQHPTELARLFGARMVTSIEVDDGKRLAEGLVKQMTGGDPMVGRLMRENFFEWMPTHKLVIAANHQPEIRGTDYAIWRRIHLIPFTVEIEAKERDPELPEKLSLELPGILNWALAGCQEWQAGGLGVPAAVEAATASYRAEQDMVGAFVEDRCTVDPQSWVASNAIYMAYTSWCEASGTFRLGPTKFGRELSERGFERGKGTAGARIWRGLYLADGGGVAR